MHTTQQPTAAAPFAQQVPPRPAYAPSVPPAPTQPLAAPVGVLAPSVFRTRIVLVLASVLGLVLATAKLMQAQALRDSFTPYRDAWFAGAISDQVQAAQAAVGFAQLALVWAAVHAAVAVTLAARLDKGRGRLRTAVVVFGAWQALLGVLGLAISAEAGGTAVVQSLTLLAAGALLAYLATRPDAVAYFNRPRH
ncbi:hypothetical protein Kpho02_68010 [Kitasatospora phosalacinea]|uniref:Uncharacterized protein n=1 Tax=Kitasatospora phosalacinea TaxID=2065 RepID=A0A9W6QGF6_9ACTN|nr:hypothetical protein [Kitasatospora phosalacinea]GLW74503.1 hypothetical protein Kpho02_68010 [Kitasatospora phosalacinea]